MGLPVPHEKYPSFLLFVLFFTLLFVNYYGKKNVRFWYYFCDNVEGVLLCNNFNSYGLCTTEVKRFELFIFM